MFRTILLSLTLLLTVFSSVSFADEVDYTKAYRVVNNRTSEILSDISFEPVVEWVNGNPYVAVKEFDRYGRPCRNLYSYNEIILEPVDCKTILR